MKYTLILALLLSGCNAVPVKHAFPEAPDTLLEKCAPLQPLQENAKLSDVAKNITNNYTAYHICSSKHDSFVEWYNIQKKIFEELGK
jgi:hypothetical protein